MRTTTDPVPPNLLTYSLLHSAPLRRPSTACPRHFRDPGRFVDFHPGCISDLGPLQRLPPGPWNNAFRAVALGAWVVHPHRAGRDQPAARASRQFAEYPNDLVAPGRHLELLPNRRAARRQTPAEPSLAIDRVVAL